MHFSDSTTGSFPAEHRRHFRNVFVGQATSAFLWLSVGMGAVAALLPVALVAAAGWKVLPSISAYYHAEDVYHAGDGARNLFVGGLWTAGTFLILFRGLSRLENGLLNLAGVFAIVVAMVPTSKDPCPPPPPPPPGVHAVSAILFFLCLSIVAVFLSKGRVRYIAKPGLRRAFKAAYNAAGIFMIGAPVAVAAVHLFFRQRCGEPWIFAIETVGMWGFAFYWFVKTCEYRLLLGARFRAPRPLLMPGGSR